MREYVTENLIVRPYRPSDYTLWKEGIDNRFPSQNTFDVGKIENADKEYFYDFLSYLGEMKKKDKLYVLAAFEKESGKHVGVLEYTILLRNGFDWGLFGISIHNQFWNKGYGKELTRLAINAAKDFGISRLECDIEEGNVQSKRMIAKFGFSYEGKRKNFYYNGTYYVDMDVYTKILRGETDGKHERQG